MTMHAMILDANRSFQWAELPMPVRKNNEVLIKVAAAAINRADLMQKDGCYSSPEGWPQWCGLEVSGIVAEAPADAKVQPGDKVCALLGGGGYSEYVTAPAEMVIPIPEGMELTAAAGLPEVWSTVYLNFMREAGGLKSGDICYIQAGASGIGIAAIQFAKLFGAQVITTVGSAEKAQFVKSLGADFVVNHRTDNVLDVLAQHHPDVALDCVVGKNFGAALAQMAFGGRWIVIASLAGGKAQVDLELVWRKRLKVIGSTLRSHTDAVKGEILSELQQTLWPHFTSGRLNNHVHAVYPISQVEEAHGVLRRAENIGKVILTF